MTGLMLMGAGLTGSLVVSGGAGPNAFSYTTDSSAPVSTLYTATAATLSGTGDPWTITISGSGFEYQVNGGSWVTSSGSANSGDTVACRGTSSASLSTNLAGTITIGTTVGTYTVGTVATTACSAFLVRVRAATTDPGPTQRGYYNTLFSAMNTAGVLTLLDGLYIFAAVDQATALLNLVQNNYNAVRAHSSGSTDATFTTLQGFTGNGVATTGAGSWYLDTGFNPTAAAGQYAQNDALLMIWSLTNANDSTWRDLGQLTTGITGLSDVMNARSSTGNTLRGIINEATGFTDYSGVTDSRGMFTFSRTGLATIFGYQNKTFLATIGNTATGIPNANLTLLGDVSTASRFSGRQLASAAFGKSMNGTQQGAFYDAIRAYMTSVGVP